MRRVLVVDDRDNVANALEALVEGDRVETHERAIAVCTPVPLGHKIALAPIAAGSPIIKYGEAIGRASVDIAAGEHVHTHNVASLFDDWLSARESVAGHR
ncbi:MAG: UxaA family hydrolase [Burkholderiaceae bacterium]|nr:UxaA family hydrolase [Burkholderiaceae bacterium]